MKRGIDVSMFVSVDIRKYMPDFVMIRGGEGCEYKDRKAKYYAQMCEDLAIPYGIYWVLDFSSGNSAEHASECLKTISELPGRVRMGVWADCETPLAYDNVAIYEFCQKIQDAGYYAGVYTGINQLRNGTVKCDAFDKWAAYYGTDSGKLSLFSLEEMDIIKQYANIWQYASGTGTEPDLDVCFIDDLQVFDLKLNGLPIPPGSGADPPNQLPDPNLADEVGACLRIADQLINKLKSIRETIQS